MTAKERHDLKIQIPTYEHLVRDYESVLEEIFQISLIKYREYQEKSIYDPKLPNPYFVERAVYESELSGGTYEIKIDIRIKMLDQ